MGRVAELAHQISTKQQRLLFDPDGQAARLTNAIRKARTVNELRKDGTEIHTMHEFIRPIEDDTRAQQQGLAGEEAEDTLLGECHDMITPIGAADASWDLKDVLSAQASDKFCATMVYYLEHGHMPRALSDSIVDENSDYEDEEDLEPKADTKSTPEVKEARKVVEMVMLLAPHLR